MPKKLIIQLIKEEMKPRYHIIKHTNPKTGVEKAAVKQYKKEDHAIILQIAELLQINDDVFKYRTRTLKIIH